MIQIYTEKTIYDLNEAESLLRGLGLKIPVKTGYTVGIYDGSKLIGTGSLAGNIIQGVGVDPEYQGEGISAKIITLLIDRAVEKGIETVHIFTKPKEAWRFEGIGFKKIAEVKPYTALLEWGRYGLDKYKETLADIACHKPDNASCIVMNCNPFTLGHRYLIEKAANQSSWLYILVVEEDVSLFPFNIRIELIKRGTEDIKNITVIPGGKYVISSLTFPSYFIREGDLAVAQISLDLEMFSRHIAPQLKIKRRFVGEEPFCEVTRFYNENMKRVLPQRGIEVVEIQRLKSEGLEISASKVRELIREDKLEKVRDIVPDSTYEYIISENAKPVIERIKNTKSRH